MTLTTTTSLIVITVINRIAKIAIFALATILLACNSNRQEGLCVLITGDVMLDRGIEKVIERKGFNVLFDNVSPFFQDADAVVINLECPLTNEVNPTRKPFVFRGKPFYADSLRCIGVTHACMANNHTYDQGTKGVADTKNHITKAGITPIGVGKTANERLRPALVINRTDTLALFSVSFLGLCNWENKEGEMGINNATATQLAATIRQFHSTHPKAKIVVLPHWGIEYDTIPSSGQRSQAELLVEAGADIIVGHHPHVLQDTCTIGNSRIYYSLGNFVFDQNRALTNKAAMLEIKMKNKHLETRLIPIKIEKFIPKLTK